MTPINKKLIMPLKNIDTCKMINYPITSSLEYKNHYYEYDENKAIHQLNNLRHCTIDKNCEIIRNCNTEFFHIDDSSILVQLAKNIVLSSNCDERKFKLNGNYFITFLNCTINLDNKTYFNNIKEIHNKYIVPNLDYKFENDTLSFNEVVLGTRRNKRSKISEKSSLYRNKHYNNNYNNNQHTSYIFLL